MRLYIAFSKHRFYRSVSFILEQKERNIKRTVYGDYMTLVWVSYQNDNLDPVKQPGWTGAGMTYPVMKYWMGVYFRGVITSVDPLPWPDALLCPFICIISGARGDCIRYLSGVVKRYETDTELVVSETSIVQFSYGQ